MPGPQLAADAAQILDVMQQRVDERAARVAGGRMHDHAGRLVEHDHVGVLVDDAQAAALPARAAAARRLGNVDDEASARRGPAVLGRIASPDAAVTLPSLISRWICDRDWLGQDRGQEVDRAAAPSCSASTTSGCGRRRHRSVRRRGARRAACGAGRGRRAEQDRA